MDFDVNAHTGPIMPRVEELPFETDGANVRGLRRFILEGGDLVADWQRHRAPVCKLADESTGICPACSEPAYPYGVLNVDGYVDACSTHAVESFYRTFDENWCELEVDPAGTIVRTSGVLYPSAWPDLFVGEVVGGLRLTPLGFKLLGMHVTVTPEMPVGGRSRWMIRLDGKFFGAVRAFPTGLFEVDMAHAFGHYATLDEATKAIVRYVEETEQKTAQLAEGDGGAETGNG